jgi:glycosyltransferase involved in cell wall biosynthesis
MNTISIVIPVYGNELNIPNLIHRIQSLQEKIGKDTDLEVVFVCDGKVDNSPSLLFEYQQQDYEFEFNIISLSQNYGAFSAIKCGIDNVEAEIVLVMSADLQEPLQLYIDIIDEIRKSGSEIVFGVRIEREDSSLLSKIYWRAYRSIIMKEVPHGGVDVFAITKKVLSVLKNMEIKNSSLIGILFQIGFNKAYVKYNRVKREAGVSKWTLRKKLKYVADSFFSFSRLPIVFIHVLGGIGIIFSVTYGVILFVLKLTSEIQVPGYTAIIIVFLFLSSLIILSLGLIGSYVWRIYENSKNLPPYLITTKSSKKKSQYPN